MKKYRMSISIGWGREKTQDFTEQDIREIVGVPDDYPVNQQILDEMLNIWHWSMIDLSCREITERG